MTGWIGMTLNDCHALRHEFPVDPRPPRFIDSGQGQRKLTSTIRGEAQTRTFVSVTMPWAIPSSTSPTASTRRCCGGPRHGTNPPWGSSYYLPAILLRTLSPPASASREQWCSVSTTRIIPGPHQCRQTPLPRSTPSIPVVRAQHDPNDRKHHRHFDQNTHHRRQRRTGLEPEQRDCGGNGKLKKVGGPDQR